MLCYSNKNEYNAWKTFHTFKINTIPVFDDLGGATVWPYAGVSVFPKKGDGIYWHNFDRNGKIDILSLHQACPVILGSKWIGSKWIGFQPQWNNEIGACGLNEKNSFYSNLHKR